MNTILLYVLIFIVVMTIILAVIPTRKIKVIGGFFAVVLPRIPLVGMIKAYVEAQSKNRNNRT